jgi:hypothetical protein
MKTELWQGILNKLGTPNVHIMEVPAYLERGAIHPTRRGFRYQGPPWKRERSC